MKTISLIVVALAAGLETWIQQGTELNSKMVFFVSKYIVILLFLVTSPVSKKRDSSPVAWLLVIGSYIPLLLLRPNTDFKNHWILVVFLGNYFFYSAIIFFSYISLGKSLGLIPELKTVKTHGAYKFSRHPIYLYSSMGLFNFILCNFTLWNLVCCCLFVLVLAVRALNEERLLVSNDAYQVYKSQTPIITKLGYLTLIPLCLTICLLFFTSPSKITTSRVSYNTDVSFFSLDPTLYDDWTSAFVANHVLSRLFDDRPNSITNPICNSLNVVCIDKESPCKRIRAVMSCLPVKGCNQDVLTLSEVEDELRVILTKKNWILPRSEICSLPGGLCIELDSVGNVKERLMSVYLRFGWSKFHNTSSMNAFGFGSHCLLQKEIPSASQKKFTLVSRSSLPTVDLTIGPVESSDIYAFERNNLRESLERISINTPVSYYVVSNPKHAFDKLPWNTNKSRTLIQKYLSERGLIFKTELPFNSVPIGRSLSDVETFNLSPNLIFHIPSFISSCPKLAAGLNLIWKDSARAVCQDLNETVQNNVLLRKPWDGFLSPLTPGAPYANSIHDQYFAATSSDSWTPSENSMISYYLIGIGLTPLYVREKLICRVRDFYLGFSDLHISDFTFCD